MAWGAWPDPAISLVASHFFCREALSGYPGSYERGVDNRVRRVQRGPLKPDRQSMKGGKWGLSCVA